MSSADEIEILAWAEEGRKKNDNPSLADVQNFDNPIKQQVSNKALLELLVDSYGSEPSKKNQDLLDAFMGKSNEIRTKLYHQVRCNIAYYGSLEKRMVQLDLREKVCNLIHGPRDYSPFSFY